MRIIAAVILGVIALFLVLALTACGGAQRPQQAQQQTEPHQHNFTPANGRPGTYRCSCGAWGIQMDGPPAQ